MPDAVRVRARTTRGGAPDDHRRPSADGPCRPLASRTKRRWGRCAWKGSYYTGDFWERGKCNVYPEIPDGWNSGGSWWNNQTPGTVARMYGKSDNLVYQTPPASSYDPTGDWGPVWYVKPC